MSVVPERSQLSSRAEAIKIAVWEAFKVYGGPPYTWVRAFAGFWYEAFRRTMGMFRRRA